MSKQLEVTKRELIQELNNRVQDRILEQNNADLLIKLINNADSISEAISIAELGTSYQRTGFHFDIRLEKFGNTIKYLKKNGKLSFNQGGIDNALIIGDNYDALQNLLIQYEGKIDVIYIDPPYSSDSLGSYAKTNYNNEITRDNLLSQLYPRLKLAKKLLSENGILFCNIDDKNYAYVKQLMDDIFSESNFISTLHWKRKKQPSYLHAQVASVMEYILVYSQNRQLAMPLSLTSPTDSNTRVDNATNILSTRILKKGIRVKLSKSDGIIKAGVYKNKSMETEYLNDVEFKEGKTINDVTVRAKFRDSQERIDKFCDEGVLFITKNLGLRRDKLTEELEKRKPITDLILDWGDNQDSDNELKSIFVSKPFDYPKPVGLIKNLVKSTGFENATVLDFYAGSGTTGQAVLELNKEDGGERKFILCTNNEIDEKINPNGIAYDVTTKRLKRVMTGSCYDGNSDFPWIKDNEPLGNSLTVYDISEVANFESTEGKTPFDVIDETAYGLPKFENINDKIAWVCENFDGTQKYLEGK